MGNGIPGNPSGTLDSGQCCRTSVDWRSCMCQIGAKVEQCWSLWCTSSLQDDDTQSGRRYSTSHKIEDDAHYDRRFTWGVAVHSGRGGLPGTVAMEFSGETGQASLSTSQSSRSYASHTRETPHDRCDDGTDASHVPRTSNTEKSRSRPLISHHLTTWSQPTTRTRLPDKTTTTCI